MSGDVLALFGIEVPRLLGPLLPVRQTTTLIGPSGPERAALVAAFAVSLGSGEELAGLVPVGVSGTVRVFDYVWGWDDWADLVARVCNGHRLEPPPIFYRAPRAAFVDELRRATVDPAEIPARLAAWQASASPRTDVYVINGAAGAAGHGGEEGVRLLYRALRGMTALVVSDEADALPSAATFGPVWRLSRVPPQLGYGAADAGAEILLTPAAGNVPSIALVIHHDNGEVRIERGERLFGLGYNGE